MLCAMSAVFAANRALQSLVSLRLANIIAHAFFLTAFYNRLFELNPPLVPLP